MLKLWLYKLSTFFFATSLSPANPSLTSLPATLDEMLTFECAREVANAAPVEKSLGPVFFREGLAFTSISSSDASDMLLINAGAGQYSVKLPSHGVNRIRFEIPALGRLKPKSYFMSFVAGGRQNSRLFELSAERVPPGRDELDFQLLHPKRSTHLLSHFEFSVFETADQLAGALAAKRFSSRDYAIPNIRACDHIARRSPGLARTLRHHLEIIVATAGSRLPASVPGK